MQKYLLATGDLNGSIHENLDLVVTGGHLNDAAVWQKSDLSPQTDFFKKNLNPLDAIFKNIAKFNAENTIIVSLLTQTEPSKIKPKDKKRALDKAAPDIKDILLKEKKLDKLKQPSLTDFDGDDDDTSRFLPLQIEPDSIPSSRPPLLSLQLDLSSPPDPDLIGPTALDNISQVPDEFDNLSAEIDNILEKKTMF